MAASHAKHAPDLKVIVDRIVRGERRQADLTRLFLWLRDRTKGKAPTVQDIGDFEAHRASRDKGLTWSFAERFCIMTDRLMAKRYPPAGDIKEVVRSGLMAAGASIDRHRLEAEARYSSRKSTQQLNAFVRRIAEKITDVDDNNEAVFGANDLYPKEQAVYNVLREQRAIQIAFTQADIIGQLTDRLLDEGLLEMSDIYRFQEADRFVALYAVSRMHMVEIALKSDRRAWLEMDVSSEPDFNVAIKLNYEIGERHVFRTPICLTNISAAEGLEDSLQPKQEMFGIGVPVYDIALELGEGGRLVPMEG